jgi:GT2 family glycosyltransferase
MTVLALVLTYSAPEALLVCVRAVVAQSTPPDEVLVLDNAGHPDAEGTLRRAGLLDDPVHVHRLPINTGPAGGHAAGLEAFLASSHALAWVMDDDCAPAPDCLERLRAACPDEPAGAPVFRFPMRVERDGVEHGFPAWSGLLVGRDVVQQAGLPRAELVWWAEDTEYLRWRIPALGVTRHVVAEARVAHTRDRTADGRRPAWRYYYEARNTVYLRTRERRSLRRIAKVLGGLTARIVLRERHRPRKLWFLLHGVVDGATGRLGLRVPLVSDRADS